jgi:transposase
MDWYHWAIRSRLEPITKVARTRKMHLEGILTAMVTGATSAGAQGFNTIIRKMNRAVRRISGQEMFQCCDPFPLWRL